MKRILAVAATLGVALSGCLAQPTATTSPATYSQYQLEYRLAADFGNVFWCDPDLYPIARPEQEQQSAIEQFPVIKANNAEFSAILRQLLLDDKSTYTDEEKLLVYRQHKFLNYAVQMTASGNGYQFVLRVGEGQGERIEGIVSDTGVAEVQKREPSVNTCPICLSKGMLINTGDGLVAVEDIYPGMLVWTEDDEGNRVLSPVIRTGASEVPTAFRLLSIVLDDGRTLTASPGHPSADGRALGEYKVGDELDGAIVVTIGLVPYNEGRTYDILPAGATGRYWANGIRVGSTLFAR